MTEAQLSILTYNTHLFGNFLPAWLIEIVEKLTGTEITHQEAVRAQAIAAKIKSSGADIVGLVELWHNDLHNAIISEVSGEYPYSYRPDVNVSLLNLKPMGHGMSLLSKYPLSEQNFYTYNQLSGADSYSLKGILTAKAELPNPSGGNPIRVRLFLTHTQAAYTDDSNENTRYANMGQLVETVKDYQTGRAYNQDTDIPIFVFGDFNIIAEDGSGQLTAEYQNTIVQIFQEAELTDSYRPLHGNFNQYPGYTYEYTQQTRRNTLVYKFDPDYAQRQPHERLDYIFYTQKGSPITVTPAEAEVFTDYTYQDSGVQDLSDHYPLWGKFNLKI